MAQTKMSSDYDSYSPAKKALVKFLLVVLLVGITVRACTAPDVMKVGYEAGYVVSESAGANRGLYLTSPNWDNYITAQARERDIVGSDVVDFERGFREGFNDAAKGLSRKYEKE